MVILQEGNEAGQLFIGEKETFNYPRAFDASSGARDASVSSFVYSLQVICGVF